MLTSGQIQRNKEARNVPELIESGLGRHQGEYPQVEGWCETFQESQ
jgi:hypothetical protein